MVLYSLEHILINQNRKMETDKNQCLFIMEEDDIPDIELADFDDIQQIQQNYGNIINPYVFGQLEDLQKNNRQKKDSHSKQFCQFEKQFDPFTKTIGQDLYQRVNVKNENKHVSFSIKTNELKQQQIFVEEQQIARQDFKGRRKNKTYADYFDQNDKENLKPTNFKKDKTQMVQNNRLIIQRSKQRNQDLRQQKQQEQQQQQRKQKNKDNKPKIEGVQVFQNKAVKLQYIEAKKAIKVSNMREFVFTPLSPIFKITAIVKKQSNGLLNLSPKYTVFIQENSKFILSIQKKPMLSSYVISLSRQNVNDTNKNFLGMIYTNFSGSQWTVYDSGFDPSETRVLQQCRKQVLNITFQNSDRGPRKFSALSATNGLGYFAIDTSKSILKQKKGTEEVQQLKTKDPEYDPIDQNYKLDFKGIVERASVKNFILLNQKGEQCMIFGRRNEESFIMEIKAPLSVFQASAICVASINYKNIF